MRIGIDLTWLKPKKSGGVEVFIRNLLDGFLSIPDDNEYVLFTAKDNTQSMKEYEKDNRVKIVECNTEANNVIGHLIWQNLNQYRILKKNNINFCFFPVYEMPIYKSKKIKNVTTIHDIQAIHYPDYFSKAENFWFRFAWKRTIKISDKVVGITDFTKKDLEENFKNKGNIVRIYLPVTIKKYDYIDFSKLRNKYNIEENQYYYTILSMYKHKNLITLLKVIKKIKDDNIKGIPNKLVVSGVGGPDKENLLNTIKEMKIEDRIVLTNFVSNEERNTLIKNCNIFLFPSLFEGFGLPPIEARMIGAKVITTKCASLEEVTMKTCEYIDNPINTDEWINQIKQTQEDISEPIIFKEYEKEKIAKQYLNLFYDVIKNK